MTKDEIEEELRAQESDTLADYVAALDVCTAAERKYLEACLEAPSATSWISELRLAVQAERTLPDPLEAFVAEVRSALRETTGSDCGAMARSRIALASLDAARSKK